MIDSYVVFLDGQRKLKIIPDLISVEFGNSRNDGRFRKDFTREEYYGSGLQELCFYSSVVNVFVHFGLLYKVGIANCSNHYYASSVVLEINFSIISLACLSDLEIPEEEGYENPRFRYIVKLIGDQG